MSNSLQFYILKLGVYKICICSAQGYAYVSDLNMLMKNGFLHCVRSAAPFSTVFLCLMHGSLNCLVIGRYNINESARLLR